MDIEMRIELLQQSGQLSKDGYKKIQKMKNYFKESLDITLLEENAAMFVTHVSIALSRIEKGGKINKIEEIVYEELTSNDYFKKCLEIITEMEDTMNVAFPQEEKDYIIMHICVLLQKEDWNRKEE